MLRIHFTGEDLARTKITAAPDLLWEVALSSHWLRIRKHDLLLAGWKQNVLEQFQPGSRLREQISLLMAVMPVEGYFPDLLTPEEAGDGFEQGIDSILSLPRQRLQKEIGRLGESQGRLDPLAVDLAEGRPGALHELGAAFRSYREIVLDPMADRIQVAFEADRSLRAKMFLDGGMEAVLNGLHSGVSISGGVLEIPDFAGEQEVYLHGRGLRLVPSYFKRADTKVMMLADPHLPQVLVYAVDRRAGMLAAAGREPLAALLGRTRAALLELTVSGGSTSELARRIDISPAAASQHLTILREAGLVLSIRSGNTMQHWTSPLGRAMLAGSP